MERVITDHSVLATTTCFFDVEFSAMASAMVSLALHLLVLAALY